MRWQLGQYLDHHPYPKDKPDISEDLVGVIDANLGAFDFKLLNEDGVAVCRLTPQETDVFATAKMRAYAQRRKSDWEAVHVGDGATRKPTPQQMAAHIAAVKKRQAEFETTLKEATEKKRQAYRRLAADDGNPVRVVVWWCGGVVVWWCSERCRNCATNVLVEWGLAVPPWRCRHYGLPSTKLPGKPPMQRRPSPSGKR